MIFDNTQKGDEIPEPFMQSWWNNTWQMYKWIIVPMLLFLLFKGDGWDALRVAWDYKETTGTVTGHGYGKPSVLEYSYTASGQLIQGTSIPFDSRQYRPGDTVRVFYSTGIPQLSVVSTIPPGWLLVKELAVTLMILLVLLPIVTMISLASEPLRDY